MLESQPPYLEIPIETLIASGPLFVHELVLGRVWGTMQHASCCCCCYVYEAGDMRTLEKGNE